MQPIREQFAEMHTTTIDYARLKITLDIPTHPYTVSHAMMIDARMLEDLKREEECKRHLEWVSDAGDQTQLQVAMSNYNAARDKANNIRETIARSITWALSDGVTK